VFKPTQLLLISSILIFSINVHSSSSSDLSISEISISYGKGEYKKTIISLEELSLKTPKTKKNKYLLGLIAYWKAITYKNLHNYPAALDNFRMALALKYKSKDIYYEYAQALYTSEQLTKAIRTFRISAKKGFKSAVSWYYVAYIYQSQKDYKKAIEAYKKVEASKDADKKDVLQPAMMQLGDIYYLLAKQRVRAVETMEKLVIPQYQKALAVNKASKQAQDIRTKIKEIQRIFDLIMFKLRNGRSTVYPPYFARLNQNISYDDNVSFSPDDSTSLTTTDTASIISTTSFTGKYTFYVGNYMSFAPEVRGSYTYHLNRDTSDIYSNDSYNMSFAVRSAYEYSLLKKPASILFDYEYSYNARDFNAVESPEYFNSTHTLMVGKRLNLINRGESIVRYKFKMAADYDDVSSTTHTGVYEQVWGMALGQTLLFLNNINLLRSDDTSNDSNSYTFRVDYIFGSLKNYGSPSLAFSSTITQLVEDDNARGTEITINPSFKFAKKINKNTRLTFNFSYTSNSSDNDDYTYTKSVYGFDYEYIF
jgi:tetratricopeptide (TPR) repeat protein